MNAGISYNRHAALIIGATSIFMLLASGCDKLNFLKPKEATKPQEEAKSVAGPVVKGTVIAKINNMPIVLEDLNQEVEAFNAMVPADKPELKITTRDKKIDYLKNEMVRRALLYQAAMDRGIDRNDDVLKALEKTKMDLLVVELIKQETDKVNVSFKEVEDYYNTYKDQLKEPVERNIREIVLSTEQEAKDALVQLLQGADFATLAKERSKAKSAKNGGDLGYLQDNKLVKEEASVAGTLEVNQTSGVFKGPDGYYIVKLEGKRGGNQKSFAEMQEDIKRGLTFLKQQQQIEDLIGKLSRQAKIEIYESEIK